MFQQETTPDPARMADLVDEMRRDFRTRSEAQQLAANQSADRNAWLNLASTVLATAGGSGAFASLATSDDGTLLAIAATLSVLAAISSELATRLGYADRVADHRKWAATAGAQARRISFAQGNPVAAEVAARRYHDFLRELQSFDTEAPSVPRDLWVRAERVVKTSRTSGPAPRLSNEPAERSLRGRRGVVPVALAAGVLIGWLARRPS